MNIAILQFVHTKIFAAMKWSLPILLFLCLGKASNGQDHPVIPASYSLFNANLYSTNGSSVSGHCASFINDIERNVSTCTNPTSSVLFDGRIPTLTRDTWASQLLTLQANASSSNIIEITFNFVNISMLIRRVEIVLLQCSQLGVSASEILIFSDTRQIASIEICNMSCTSLSQVCIRAQIISNQALIIQFFGSERIHIAEVKFYLDSSDCPQDSFITANYFPNMPTTKSVLPDTSQLINTQPEVTYDRTSQESSATSIITSEDRTNQESSIVTSIITSEDEPVTDNLVITVILSTVVPSFFFILVCVVAAFLFLWRCYYAKHHKYKTNSHMEGGHVDSSPPMEPPLVLCKETGQVFYNIVGDEEKEVNNPQYRCAQEEDREKAFGQALYYSVVNCDKMEEAVNPQYSIVQGEDSEINTEDSNEYAVPFHDKESMQCDAISTGATAKHNTIKHSVPCDSVNCNMPKSFNAHEKVSKVKGGKKYSTLSDNKDKVQSSLDQVPSSSLPKCHLYAEVTKSGNPPLDCEETEDLQYSSIDETKKKAVKLQNPSLLEHEYSYAQIDKKKEHATETIIPLDQQYAEINDQRATTLAHSPDRHHRDMPATDHDEFYSLVPEKNDRAEQYPNVAYSDVFVPGEDGDEFEIGLDENMTVVDPEIVSDEAQDEPEYAQVNKPESTTKIPPTPHADSGHTYAVLENSL